MENFSPKPLSPVVFIRGRFTPSCEAHISPSDAGFVSGATIVDNARTFNGKLFRWADHLARFRRDCETCYVPMTATDAELTSIATELLRRNRPATPPHELHVVTVATPGPPEGPPTLMMSTYPIRIERYRPFFTEGVTLSLAGVFDQTSSLLPPKVKHRSRLHWHIAEQIVRERAIPNAVPVIVNNGAFDTAIGGIAAVLKDGTILLPEPGMVQESISIQTLAELGSQLGFSVRTGRITSDSSDIIELVLCGTGFAIAGVKMAIDRRHRRTFDWPGPVYRQLLAAWSQLVGVDIEAQFRDG